MTEFALYKGVYSCNNENVRVEFKLITEGSKEAVLDVANENAICLLKVTERDGNFEFFRKLIVDNKTYKFVDIK